ncbi:protein smoothened [Planococcus citri]|uniref:protein smoothened n=1 Tax=Planococcus citri TaxID=170843 RepID=UPI0031F7EC58
MDFTVLLYSLFIHWTFVSSAPSNNDGYPSFSPNNLIPGKQLRNKEFREYNETDEGISSRPLKPRYCVTRAECIPLNNTTCLGVKVPYTRTSLGLVADISTQEEAQERLHKWHKTLIHIPKCWAVVQPFLCALFMPKCEDGQVVLPSKEMCDKIQYPCRILITQNLWPAEFNCTPYKQEKCKNDMSELKFNTASQCMAPLVKAEQESSYYEGIEGCGVQCQDPFFSEEERKEIGTYVLLGSVAAFLSNLFAVVTLILDWKSTSKFPTALAVLYLNISFLMVSIGHLYQLRPGANDHTICHKDGTLRTSEPSLGGNLSCVTSFVFVYYFLIAGIVWFVVVAYAWDSYVKRSVRGGVPERKDKRIPYYHISAWSLPVILTVTIMALGEVDGDSLLHVCFVGGVNKKYRLIFFLGPLLFLVVGWLLFMKGVVTLLWFKMTNKEHISPKSNKTVWTNIFRVLIFSNFILLFGVVTFIYHIYEYLHHEEWKNSLRKSIICQLNFADDTENCRIWPKPSLSMIELRILALFGTNISMALWVFEKSAKRNWIILMKRILHKEINESNTITKHKLISFAYAKRKNLENGGNLSIDMNNHQDPVGLNFELNSLGSRYCSSSWAKVLPKLITRRGALAVVSRSNSSQRGNSVDSEYSINFKRVSIESHSRRHSIESTVSMQTVEVKKMVHKRRRDKRRRDKKCNYKYKTTETKISSRHSSTSSLAKNLEKEVMGIFISNERTTLAPNMNRRCAITGIGNSTLNLLDIGREIENRSDNNDSSNSSVTETDSEMQQVTLPS